MAWRLWRAGFRVVVTELAEPLTLRRTVALSSAVHDGRVDIEGMTGVLARSPDAAAAIARSGIVGVVVAADLPALGASVVVDARMAKVNIDTGIDDAALVVGLGPGFTAGLDCHAVVETMRGPRLGRVITSGSAAPDTGIPGVIGGQGAGRVLRSPAAGHMEWIVGIGDVVTAGAVVGRVDGADLVAPFDGVVRGLIAQSVLVRPGLKVGDIDPRRDPGLCHEISDKALAIGGGALESVTAWLHHNG